VGLLPNGAGGFTLEVELRTTLPENLSREVGRELIRTTHDVCPYSHATRGNIPVDLLIE
jgi:organic hydroperoxide reductase OsmC/OhrA